MATPLAFNSTGVIDSSAQTNFLDLPYEIRQQIYSQVVPACRLAPFPYIDPEWSMKPPNGQHRAPHALMFVSRTVYNEVAPIVYSRAVLEIAPTQAGYPILATGTKTSTIPYNYTRLLNQFRFYRPEFLKLIRRAHVFSNQADVIDSTSYDCMLQWLIIHTSVKDIDLALRPMTRIAGRVTFDFGSWRSVFFDDSILTKHMRIIRVWTRAKRPPWEFEKIMRMRDRTGEGSLSPLQVYFWSAGADLSKNLQLDPRWSTRHNEVNETGEAGRLIDQVVERVLTGQEMENYRYKSRHYRGDQWVYQVVLASERVRLMDGMPESPKGSLR